MTARQYWCEILWGENPTRDEQEPVRYTFPSHEAMVWFLEGVDEASGWLDYEVTDSSETEEEKKPEPVAVRFTIDISTPNSGSPDDAWAEAVDILRAGGGDITRHAILDADGNTLEEGGE